jgi:outer membrane receptor protein involved in Fe transport
MIDRKRHYYLFILFFLIRLTVSAQDPVITIEGTVHDNASGKPIEFATIQLIRLPDSAIVKTTASGKKGEFRLEEIPTANYLVRCSFIGYEVSMVPPVALSPGSAVYTVGRVDLSISGKALAEVTVTSKKQSLVTGIDRKIYNVDQDIMSRSGSVSDILKNIPSVEVDIEGGVLLRGSGDVMILINGKPSPLMGRSRAEILQQIPANTIERIEVITNPSARYRPDGVSGIINIVLKKNTRNGFNGSVILNAGNRDRYNGSFNLNYRPKKFNLFANYSRRLDTRRRFNDLERFYLDSITGLEDGIFRQNNSFTGRPKGHVASAGMDHTINDRNSIGISGTLYSRDQLRNIVNTNYRYDSLKQLTEHFDRFNRSQETERERSLSAFFTHKFPGDDHQLEIEFNADRSKEIENNRFTNRHYFPPGNDFYDNTIIKVTDNEYQLTIDYSTPLPGDAKLEAGYDGNSNKEDLDFYGEYFDPVQPGFIKDSEKTNRFIFEQNIHAVYTTLEKTWEKWGLTVGLRAEQVNTNGNLVTLDSIIKNNYFKIYPTLHLGYALKEGHELQLNYSKRVNRPDGDDLNPFPEYQDPRNLRSGNPKLLPELIHSVEFGYKWQHKQFSFVPSIYYRYKVNGYTQVTEALDDTILLTRMQNLSRDQSAGLELIFSAKAGKWFSTNLSSNIFYNRIEAAAGTMIGKRSIISMSANFNNNFNIGKTTVLQAGINYRSARLTPQGKTYPTVVLNMGMRQDLFRNKVSLSLTASDIFNSLRQKTKLNTSDFLQTNTSRRDGRVVYLGISYRFGIIKKEKEEKMQFDDNL